MSSFNLFPELEDLLKGVIRSYTESELNSVACIELPSLVNTNLTEFIQTLNSDIRPFINPPPPPNPPSVPKGMVNLTDNPLIELFDYALDSLIGVDGPLGINAIVNQVNYFFFRKFNVDLLVDSGYWVLVRALYRSFLSCHSGSTWEYYL